MYGFLDRFEAPIKDVTRPILVHYASQSTFFTLSNSHFNIQEKWLIRPNSITMQHATN